MRRAKGQEDGAGQSKLKHVRRIAKGAGNEMRKKLGGSKRGGRNTNFFISLAAATMVTGGEVVLCDGQNIGGTTKRPCGHLGKKGESTSKYNPLGPSRGTGPERAPVDKDKVVWKTKENKEIGAGSSRRGGERSISV